MLSCFLFIAILFSVKAEETESTLSFRYGIQSLFLTDIDYLPLNDATNQVEFNLLNLISGSAVLNPKFEIEDTWVDLNISPLLRITNSALPTISFNEIDLNFKIGDFINLKTGLIKHRPGSALFFSNVEFFTSQDILTTLQEGIEAESKADDLIIVKLLGENWHLNGLFSPFLLKDNFLPTDSIWFPYKGIKKSFQVGSYKYYLNKIDWAEETQTELSNKAFSYSCEAGYTLGPVDLALFYFYGTDRYYATSAKITLPVEPWGTYNIELFPSHGIVEKLGLTTSLQLESLRFYIDGCGFKGKTISTNDLYNAGTNWETQTRKVDGIDFSYGLSWNLPIPDGFLALESRYAWYADIVEGDTYPPLDKAACVLFSGSLFDQFLSYSFLSVLSLTDYSYCILPSLNLPIGGDNKMGITLPLFFGTDTSDFGQYRKQTILKLSGKFQL